MAEGPYLWDIGCDHSILAKINQKQGRFMTVYCVDKSINSLDKINLSRGAIDNSKTKLIHSDGCDLDWKQVSGSVVIAGVGGNTVIKVVASCPKEKREELTWIMNPFTSVDKFLKEIPNLFPHSELVSTKVIEKKRERTIYKWQKQSAGVSFSRK